MNGEQERLRVHLFGEARFTFDARPLPSASPKTMALCAFVILRAEAAPSRDAVAAALWPDVSDTDARANLRRHLSLLQRLLPDVGTPWILSEARSLQWNDAAPAWVDVRAFDAYASSDETLEQAVELYRGDLLERLADEWIVPLREAYRERVVALLMRIVERAERERDIDRLVRAARRLLRIDPMREDVVRRLMSVRATSGDRAAALAEYTDFARRLKEDVDAEPMAETTALYDALRRGDPIDGSAPAPRASVGLAATSFVGRLRDLAVLRALIRDARLVSLTGVGGIGKSRLAHALASDIATQFSDGATFVELAPLPDASDPLQAVVRALGLPEMAPTAMQRVLTEYLQPKQLLLVLDNCERHVPQCRALTEAILRSTPRVTVLATSRTPLRAAGETMYQVGPLSIPVNVGDGREHPSAVSEAVQLFEERARAAGATKASDAAEERAIVEICRHFDGIPLAIELAAARRRLLSAQQIAAKLAEPRLVLDAAAPHQAPHQRSVRAALQWSFDGLHLQERQTICSLSVLRTPFTFDAAETVAGQSVATLDLLSALIDSSLLLALDESAEVRYRMLEPVREFAFAELEENHGSRSAFERAVSYYRDAAERYELPEGGVEPRVAFAFLERERINVRAAIEGASQFGYTPEAVELAERAFVFWQERGYVADGRATYDALLAALPPETVGEAPWRLLVGASAFERLAADYGPARRHAQAALEAARDTADRVGVAEGLHALALLDYTQGDLESAHRRHQEICALCGADGDTARLGRALANLGLVEMPRGNYDRAATYLMEAVEALERSGSARWLAAATSALAFAERFRGHFDEARHFSEQTLAAARDAGDLALVSTSLCNLAHVAVLAGREQQAVPYLRECLALARDGGFLYTAVHALEICARAFYAGGRYLDCAAFIHASQSIAARLSLVRATSEVAALDSLESEAEVKLSEQERFTARTLLRGATLERCIYEVLLRLDALAEPREAVS